MLDRYTRGLGSCHFTHMATYTCLTTLIMSPLKPMNTENPFISVHRKRTFVTADILSLRKQKP